jgi:hypothetical protein
MMVKIHKVRLARRLALVLSVASVIFIGMPTAEAKQCSVAPPSRSVQGHWSYRLIDGRKCWYEGENNFPKSLLQWPERDSALSAFGEAEPSPDEGLLPSKTQTSSEKRRDQADPDGCCKTLKESESFEARWRGLEMMR